MSEDLSQRVSKQRRMGRPPSALQTRRVLFFEQRFVTLATRSVNEEMVYVDALAYASGCDLVADEGWTKQETVRRNRVVTMVTDGEFERLSALAQSEGRSVSAVVHEILSKHLAPQG